MPGRQRRPVAGTISGNRLRRLGTPADARLRRLPRCGDELREEIRARPATVGVSGRFAGAWYDGDQGGAHLFAFPVPKWDAHDTKWDIHRLPASRSQTACRPRQLHKFGVEISEFFKFRRYFAAKPAVRFCAFCGLQQTLNEATDER